LIILTNSRLALSRASSVRKDLVRRFKGHYPVPTYVTEFLLGRYCATVNEDEIRDGLEIVQRQLGDRTVRAGEEELFKARAKEKGSVRVIDVIRARLDTKTDQYLVELPSLRINDARITDTLVHEHDRMLTGGFYAEINLVYDPLIAEESNGRPFGVESLKRFSSRSGTAWRYCARAEHSSRLKSGSTS
jgi:ATP-dependent Lon protease